MTRYQILLQPTRVVLDTVDAAKRAQALADWHFRRLQHPKYPPQVIVERVGEDGKRRRVFTAGVMA